MIYYQVTIDQQLKRSESDYNNNNNNNNNKYFIYRGWNTLLPVTR